MTGPMVQFPDPRAVVSTILRTHVRATLGLSPTGLRVGTLDPEDRKPEHQGLPYVKVSQDSATVWRNAVATVNVRLTFWHEDEFLGLQLASAVRAVLAAYPGDEQVKHIGRATFPFPATDPDTLAPMASFNMDVRLTPTVLLPS